MVQAPHFVYRAELQPAPGGEQPVPLSPHELAARLSYALWGTLPDGDLLEAAASGALDSPEGVGVEVSRMLEDARSEDTLVHYHELLLSVGRYRDITRSSMLFPSFSSAVPTAMQDEVRLFVRDVFESDGGVRDLYTSRSTYVNEPLATIYGLEGVSGDEMRRVSLEGRLRGLAHHGRLPRAQLELHRQRPDPPRRLREPARAVRAAARATDDGPAAAPRRHVDAPRAA
jgi:hypothetical protein